MGIFSFGLDLGVIQGNKHHSLEVRSLQGSLKVCHVTLTCCHYEMIKAFLLGPCIHGWKFTSSQNVPPQILGSGSNEAKRQLNI